MVVDPNLFTLAPTAELQIRKLAEFIVENFSEEIDGRLGVDIAIQLLQELKGRILSDG